MSNLSSPRGKRAVLPHAIALICLGAAAPLVYAQPAASAQQTQTADYDIAAGSLDKVLNQFAVDAGVSLAIDGARTEGRRSAGLKGRYGVEQGFAELLRDSGLQAVKSGDGRYVLRAASTSSSVLPTLKINADAVNSSVTEGSGSLTSSAPLASATGLGLALKETPQSITLVTRERMQQQNLTTLADVAEQVTGVHYVNKGAAIGGRTLMYARGFEVDSYQIDGVNVPWEAMAESERYGHGALDTAIYDSITIVRGSTGLVTGTGDPSALMALTRKKPTRETQTVLEASAGRWDHYRLMADVGGALNTAGSVRGRVVGAYDEGKSWVDHYSSDRSVFYGIVEADLDERTLLTVTLEHGTADSKGAPWAEDYGNYLYFDDDTTPTPKRTSTNIAPHWSYLNSDRSFASLALEHQFSDDWSAKLTYGYGKFNTDMRRGMVNSIAQDGSPTIARVLALDYEHDTHIVDARVDGRYALFGREHEVVAGIDMYRTEVAAPLALYDDARGLGAVTASWNNGRLYYTDPDWDALEGSEGDYPYDVDTKQQGAYVATRLRPADRVSVILGGRVTNWESKYEERPTPTYDGYVYYDVEYDDEFTPYAGVVVDVTNALSVYASYTQIFKPQEVTDTAGKVLDAEEGDTYEIGLKGGWFDERLNASAAVFESKRENLAVALEDGNGAILNPKGEQAYRAADHTEGRGWEFEVAGALTPRWQIQAGFTRFRNEDSDGKVIDTTQPERQFKLYTAYQPRLVPKLTVGASLRWQNDTSSLPDYIIGDPSLNEIDSYTVLGANLGYELNKQLSLSLNLNNALDKEYRVSPYNHSYGAPRNLTATVRATF